MVPTEAQLPTGIWSQATAATGALLTPDQVTSALTQGLAERWRGARVLLLIPDLTRSLPLPQLFPMIVAVLAGVRKLDLMVALGTHPPLSEAQFCQLLGITPAERASKYAAIGCFNHEWDNPAALQHIGTISQAQVQDIAGARWHPTLGGDIPIRINRRIFDYDQIVILGPTFPHEVVGFSGGAKYLFPGISGAEMINVTHWLGALAGVRGTIGIEDTPVRALIHAAAEQVTVPVALIALVVAGQAEKPGLAGVFIGEQVAAWRAAVALSAQRHIIWHERPFQQILSCAPPMYDELWTAGKAMYKLDAALADDGEIVIFAPHLSEISRVHGAAIEQIGYHVLDYFLQQWPRFSAIPLGILAHSTHVRGDGRYEHGVEYPRVKVVLASQIPSARCHHLALGYADPLKIDPAHWRNREDEGYLYVPKAGEVLHRVRPATETETAGRA